MSAGSPGCSIIIPTYNRAAVLRLCLDALAAQENAASRIEIIVVDDGSSDGTDGMVSGWAAASPVPVQYVRQANAGANAARNAAIRLARAPLLLIINDDTIAASGLLARHLAMHAEHPEPGAAVLGRMTIDPALPPSLFAPLHHDASFRQFEGRRVLGWDAFFTCNLSVKTGFLLHFGLFDEGLRWHEDIELGERLVPHGLRLFYCPEALGLHHHALTEADYLNIAVREGRSLVRWHAKAAAAGVPDNTIVRDGLHPAARHHVAGLVLNRWTLPAATAAARLAAHIWPQGARAVYARIFQAHKRLTIRKEKRK